MLRQIDGASVERPLSGLRLHLFERTFVARFRKIFLQQASRHSLWRVGHAGERAKEQLFANHVTV
jgi:hypothetical protein